MCAADRFGSAFLPWRHQCKVLRAALTHCTLRLCCPASMSRDDSTAGPQQHGPSSCCATTNYRTVDCCTHLTARRQQWLPLPQNTIQVKRWQQHMHLVARPLLQLLLHTAICVRQRLCKLLNTVVWESFCQATQGASCCYTGVPAAAVQQCMHLQGGSGQFQ